MADPEVRPWVISANAMRSLLTVAKECLPEPEEAEGPGLAFIALSGALLTCEGEDVVTPGLRNSCFRPTRTLATGMNAGGLRGTDLGLRTLALVSEAFDGTDVQTLVLHTVIDGWNLVRGHGQSVNLQRADLRGAQLSHADLRGTDLRNSDLRGANLERADLRGALLGGADLRGAVLRRSNLIDADLRKADLQRADLSHSDFRGARLGRSALRGAELWSAFVGHASMEDAYLEGVEVSRADERGSREKTIAAALEPVTSGTSTRGQA
ncbi:pentapeptide repeat-containing protein [Streptomyces sp. NPDC048361]|uniref:pentapeptide repeat-containing protein n=1 Tax=Streptomyces sp. NPDC048361 TaxID=3154720 RepID=UPI00341CD863